MIFLGESLGSVTLKMDMAQNDDIPFWNSFRSYKCPALCCYSNFEPMHKNLPSQRNPDFAWQKRDKDVWHFCLAPKPSSEATSCSWVNHPDLFGKDFLLWKRCGSFFCSAQFRPNPGFLSMMVSGHGMSIRSNGKVYRKRDPQGRKQGRQKLDPQGGPCPNVLHDYLLWSKSGIPTFSALVYHDIINTKLYIYHLIYDYIIICILYTHLYRNSQFSYQGQLSSQPLQRNSIKLPSSAWELSFFGSQAVVICGIPSDFRKHQEISINFSDIFSSYQVMPR